MGTAPFGTATYGTCHISDLLGQLSFLKSTGYAPKHTTMGFRDEWPSGPDGNQYDGKQLMHLVQIDESPFRGVWDVKLLIKEIEEKLNTQVTNIPMIETGANNYVNSHLYIRSRSTQDAHLFLGLSL